MNPNNPKHIARLRKAIKASRKNLAPFRSNRLEALREYVGSHYSENGADKDVPMNVLALAVMIYARNMFPHNPHVLVESADQAQRWRAENFQIALNDQLKKIKFKSQAELLIINSMFGMGIMKVGLESDGLADIEGMLAPKNARPFAKCISLDDWVHDTCAREWGEISFCGNTYRLPLEKVQQMQELDEKVRKSLKPTLKTASDTRNEDRAEDMARGGTYDQDEVEDFVELQDIWLPREKLLVTLGETGDVPLAIEPWEGPEAGPYHVQSFISVPDNIMPVPPCAHWLDLHRLINSLMRKLSRQANREKEILLARRGGEDDADRIKKSSDGDIVASDDPANTVQQRFGGPDQATLMFLLQCKDQVSWLAGNLDSLGGLAPQAETLGAEQLLASNASKQMHEMQDRTIESITEIVTDLGWWVWTDPVTDYPIRQKAGHIEVQSTFTPEDRSGNFYEYNIQICPYSLQDQSPAQRLQTMTTFVERFAAPMLPVMAQQGLSLDVSKFASEYARYTNMPVISELLVPLPPPPQVPPGAEQTPPSGGMPPLPPPGKPAVTTRVEERRSRPGGNKNSMLQMLANLPAKGGAA